MFNKYKLWQKALLILLFIFLAASFVFVSSVEARSGCCSHHDGVCTYTCPDGINFGHYCCDGTSLSSTCAPYYSSCPVILLTPQLIPELVREPTPSKTETPEDITNTEVQKNNGQEWFWILLGITITGSIAWALLKRKANDARQ